MNRRLAFGSIAMNVVLVSAALFALVPWLLNLLKPLKVELPAPIIWLIDLRQFLLSPVGVVFLAATVIVGLAARKRVLTRV